MAHTKVHDTKAARLNGLASQRMMLQRKTADTLRQALGALVPLAASLQKARVNVCRVFKERDEVQVKLEQADGAGES